MKYIALIIIIAVAFAAGFYTHAMISKREVGIKEVIVHETKYVKIPANCEEAYKCARSPIRITAEMETEEKMHIVASDECKSAEAEIKIEANVKDQDKNVIIGFVTGVIITIVIGVLL